MVSGALRSGYTLSQLEIGLVPELPAQGKY
jgi:hypothetical protein